MGQGPESLNGLAQFLPMLFIAIPFAIGFYHVAGRMGRNQFLWALLSLVPVINFFFFMYAWFAIVLYVLDRLNATSGMGVRPAK